MEREGLTGAAAAAVLADATSRPARTYRCRQCERPWDSAHMRRGGRVYCPENSGGLTRELWRARTMWYMTRDI